MLLTILPLKTFFLKWSLSDTSVQRSFLFTDEDHEKQLKADIWDTHTSHNVKTEFACSFFSEFNYILSGKGLISSQRAIKIHFIYTTAALWICIICSSLWKYLLWLLLRTISRKYKSVCLLCLGCTIKCGGKVQSVHLWLISVGCTFFTFLVFSQNTKPVKPDLSVYVDVPLLFRWFSMLNLWCGLSMMERQRWSLMFCLWRPELCQHVEVNRKKFLKSKALFSSTSQHRFRKVLVACCRSNHDLTQEQDLIIFFLHFLLSPSKTKDWGLTTSLSFVALDNQVWCEND